MQELVDLHIFAGARKVVADLRQHDCTAALVWCEEHKGRLKKGKNKLEFRLRMQVSFYKIWILQNLGCLLCLSVTPAKCRGEQWTTLQEFVELVRQGNMMAAIKYARGYLSPWASIYLQELQVCVPYRHQIATLGFKGLSPLHDSVVMHVQHHGQWQITLHSLSSFLRLHTDKYTKPLDCTCVVLHTAIRDDLWFIALPCYYWQCAVNVRLIPVSSLEVLLFCAASNGHPSIQSRHPVQPIQATFWRGTMGIFGTAVSPGVVQVEQYHSSVGACNSPTGKSQQQLTSSLIVLVLFFSQVELHNVTQRCLQAGISALKAPVLTASARKEDPLALKVFYHCVADILVVWSWQGTPMAQSNHHIAQKLLHRDVYCECHHWRRGHTMLDTPNLMLAAISNACRGFAILQAYPQHPHLSNNSWGDEWRQSSNGGSKRRSVQRNSCVQDCSAKQWHVQKSRVRYVNTAMCGWTFSHAAM